MLASARGTGSSSLVHSPASAAAASPLPSSDRTSRGAGASLGLLTMLVHDSPLGVLVVDPSLRVVFANPSALAILERNDAIGLACGALHEREGRVLEPRLQRALCGELDPAGELATPFHLPRRSGRRPYEVTLRAAPPGEGVGPWVGVRHVLVYVRDPDAGVPIDEKALRSRYGLTPAEARTAVALTLGGTLPEHSELLKLRPMTIRSYIKQIFTKTDTHSQPDLVRLVLTGVASLASGDPPACR